MMENDLDSDLEEKMEMVKDFVTEGRELLDDAEPQIIDLEKGASDSGKLDEEILNTIFRLFHSLKGTASFLDFQTIIGVTHEAETLLDIFRKGKATVTPYHVDLLCRTTDFIRNMLDVVERKFSDDGFEDMAEDLIDDLKQVITAINDEGEAGSLQLQERQAPVDGGQAYREPETPDGLEMELDELLSGVKSVPDDVSMLLSGDLETESQHPEGEQFKPSPNLDEMGLRIMPEMSRRFTEEVLELSEEAESALLQLEKMPDRESAGQAFRAFHSIKGNAGFFGYGDLEKISHLAENVLDGIREGEKIGDEIAISVLLKVVDVIRGRVNGISCGEDGKIPDFDQICEDLEQLADREAGQVLERGETPICPPPPVEELEQLEAAGSNEKIPESDLTEQLEAPPRPAPKDGPPALSSTPATVIGIEPQPSSNEFERSSQLVPKAKAGIGAPAAGQDAAASGAASAPRQSSPADTFPAPAGSVIRVDIDRLDKLLDLVGELVIAESMVANSQDLDILNNDRFGKAITQLDKISREIQEVAMSMRMIPLAGVFRKMMRLVRDLAQKANKQVDLEIIGEETEVDKTLIEQISDPLVHLIRNAVDHGLEQTAERLAAGKPEVGHVTIEAKHSAGEVWITVEDDGRGLNRQKIFQKGVERGLIKSEDAGMKDEDLWRLIFEPGFSTAEQVSNISGRGVGMDVVKRNIERLRGKVDIRSKAGIGTVFAVRIPLTLAIIEGMVVRVGANRYTIPISSVKESFRPSPEQITCTPDGLEIVRIRGGLLPVLRLHELYRVLPRHRQLNKGILIVVESSDNKCCLFVDELLGQQQIVIKGLPGYLNHVKGVSGCAILGDGEISMILDIADLVSSVET
ncbi:MAG: chemotaxis protein CheA [Thermacetogeniaceae bacterium]